MRPRSETSRPLLRAHSRMAWVCLSRRCRIDAARLRGLHRRVQRGPNLVQTPPSISIRVVGGRWMESVNVRLATFEDEASDPPRSVRLRHGPDRRDHQIMDNRIPTANHSTLAVLPSPTRNYQYRRDDHHWDENEHHRDHYKFVQHLIKHDALHPRLGKRGPAFA